VDALLLLLPLLLYCFDEQACTSASNRFQCHYSPCLTVLNVIALFLLTRVWILAAKRNKELSWQECTLAMAQAPSTQTDVDALRSIVPPGFVEGYDGILNSLQDGGHQDSYQSYHETLLSLLGPLIDAHDVHNFPRTKDIAVYSVRVQSELQRIFRDWDNWFTVTGNAFPSSGTASSSSGGVALWDVGASSAAMAFNIKSEWMPFCSTRPTFRNGFLLLKAEATADDAEASGQTVWQMANEAQRKTIFVKKGTVTVGKDTTQHWLVWIGVGTDMGLLKRTAEAVELVQDYGSCNARALADNLKRHPGMEDVPKPEPEQLQKPSKRRRAQQQQQQQQRPQYHVPEAEPYDLTPLGTALRCDATVETVVAKLLGRCEMLANAACDALHEAAGNADLDIVDEVRVYLS
jgi:hypothetical protein